ncbi:hypothetical protein [Yersinia bercovieri]|uniref:hypothetical protein n=1 Tax=Yersinia bercovieri TaxID=634 RepID=UPI001CFE7B40|nr:hypothetical protein [Yersinia bercovieri]MCB5301189.1 hypothetical protein [Yersinia bercovieri]
MIIATNDMSKIKLGNLINLSHAFADTELICDGDAEKVSLEWDVEKFGPPPVPV